MITQPIGAQGDECFLCVLDSHPCAVKKLEGRIINAYEGQADGEKVPFITLDTGTAFASLSLTRYYLSLVKGLSALGDAIRHSNLVLRVYHLPPVVNITEHKGRSVYRYRANAYTLAILEPDTIFNITDLNHAEYCARQYLLHRLASSPMSAAAVRGNLVHHSFKELLKEHDRGELMTNHTSNAHATPLTTLQYHFEQALENNSIDLALAHISGEAIREEAAPHLESLATWFENQRTTLWDLPASAPDEQSEDGEEEHSGNLVRAETFLLAPEIGLRGRLDLLWQQTGRRRLLELKTGGAKGELPRSAHKWQVRGYHALLMVRRESQMKKALATLLYSGTPGEALAFEIRFTVKEMQRVNETRNTLVLSHVTGIPPAPPGPSRCTKCAMLQQCEQVSSLLTWQPPEPEDTGGDEPHPTSVQITAEDREFFATYYHLLQLEGHEGEVQQALLWKTSLAERIMAGTAIGDLQPLGPAEPTGNGEWEQTFLCHNTSELRQGDEVLLSNGDPITGEVVTGTIKQISAEQVRVWSPERIAHPTLVDRYDSSIVHVRTLQNLLRWLQVDPRLRGLVAGTLRPRFDTSIRIFPIAGLNAEQNLAVERAMQMQDYLLIHGPPGTGKTSVIAEIVKRLCQQGQRVLLAAFTNQAVDNMLKRLSQEGFEHYVRLGHERSIDESVKAHSLHSLHSLQKLVESGTPTIGKILQSMPVLASTTATWSSDKYPADGATEDTDLQFDVAIIDEAGQLTMPAILGALRFARRFILVGDEKQLPPLVLSKQASAAGLADSLFSMLKRLDYGYTKYDLQEGSACVALKVQYRMNKWISHFASKVFYDGQLVPAPAIANHLLELVEKIEASKVSMEAPSITQAISPTRPLVFLDVPTPLEDEGYKLSNAEARVVREVVAGLLAHGVAPQDIGIIAPYRAQVANLRRHLFSDDATIGWQALAFDTPLSVDTVDRFQGGERKVMILSFATPTAPTAESPLRDHLTNPHRLNVALTRAQRKLILVGCASALAELPVFQRLLAYCRGLQTVLVCQEPVACNGTGLRNGQRNASF